MLLPFRDENPAVRRPIVTWFLIAANTLLFLSFVSSAPTDGFFAIDGLDTAWNRWSLREVPTISGHEWTGFFTHMFLHGNVIHLLFNMLMLYIFGDNLEDTLGHFWFLAYYLACGFAGGLVFSFVEEGSLVRAGGASGAIAGLMGGYLLLFPKARIVHLLMLPNIFWPFSVIVRQIWNNRFFGYLPIWIVTIGLPAWVPLLVWLLLNIAGARYLDGGTVAYWIHLGGFAAGLALMLPVMLFRSPAGAAGESSGDLPDAPAHGGGEHMEKRGPWDRTAAEALAHANRESAADGPAQIENRPADGAETVQSQPRQIQGPRQRTEDAERKSVRRRRAGKAENVQPITRMRQSDAD